MIWYNRNARPDDMEGWPVHYRMYAGCMWRLGGPAPLPASERLFSVASVPHGWLFPEWRRLSTTVAPAPPPQGYAPECRRWSCRSWRPAVLGTTHPCSGRGSEARIPHRRLGVENLTRSIRLMVTDVAMRRRSAEVGARIRR